MFKWTCLALVVAISSVGLWMVNDIRLRSQESMANLEVITENVADIVVDINALKNLSGLSATDRADGGRLSYATSILSFMSEELEGKGIEIDSRALSVDATDQGLARGAGNGISGLVLGKAKSQEDIFWGLCQTFPGNPRFSAVLSRRGRGSKARPRGCKNITPKPRSYFSEPASVLDSHHRLLAARLPPGSRRCTPHEDARALLHPVCDVNGAVQCHG